MAVSAGLIYASWIALFAFILSSSLIAHSAAQLHLVAVPSEHDENKNTTADTDEGPPQSDLRYGRQTAVKVNPEDEYELDPVLIPDPLNLSCLVMPGDHVGRSVIGVLKVVQMFRMVGAPLMEPYAGSGLPVAPVAPGPTPVSQPSGINPFLPYFLMSMNTHGGGSHGGGGGYGGGDSG
ncbi:hypothetical protein BV898_01967 [Hypsibius exemplaris]|uniref:Uncharacterized protein n=1 Tax=Hypsibius exemplaris TaxID=2072580 RepID=A0A1W0X9D2_HYPEX|nr:hypothetical protein BV898_01967 [Hypsibius exemplaris]